MLNSGSFRLFINDYLAIMKIDVSNGEVIDKLTILEIKLMFIDDPGKIKNVRKEYDEILPVAKEIINLDHKLVNDLRAVNMRLWKIEDDIRAREKDGDFGPEFVELSRSVYKNNDLRASIKKEININTGSGLIEEKSYSNY